jgi:hypothetical protein
MDLRRNIADIRANPKKSEVSSERVENARNYIKNFQLSIKEACKLAGCSDNTLTRHDEHEALGNLKPLQRGPKPLLNEKQGEVLHDAITSSALSLKSIVKDTSQGGKEVVDAVLKATQPNTIANSKPYSQRTLGRVLERAKVIQKLGNMKNSSRVTAFLNLRNQLSLAAGVQSLIKDHDVDSSQINSSDDTSIQVNAFDGKVKVLTTKEAEAIQESYKTNTATKMEEEQRRIVKINITINPEGHLCSIIQLCEPKVINAQLFDLFKLPGNIYYLLYHPNINPDWLYAMVYDMVIIPNALHHNLNQCNVNTGAFKRSP